MESILKESIGRMVQDLVEKGVYNISIGRSTDSEYLNIQWTEPKTMQDT